MKFILYLILVFNIQYCFAQELAKSDFINYNNLINNAELAIIDSTYDKALNYYLEAFSGTNSPMSKDLHNACVCAIKAKKYNNIYSFFEMLVQKGVKMEYFKSDIYKPIHNTNKWKLFEKEYPDKIRQAELNQNIELKNSIACMFSSDQDLAKKKDEDHSLRPEFQRDVRNNEASFIQIIKKYGFPCEDVIGIDTPSENKYMILLIHFMQGRAFEEKENDSLTYYLHKAVKDGKFSPYLYADLLEMDKTNNVRYGTLVILGINKTHMGLRNFTKEEENEINNNRKLIGLESIKDYHKKILYVYNHPKINNEFKLYYSGAKLVFFFDDDTGEKMWKDLLKQGKYISIPLIEPN